MRRAITVLIAGLIVAAVLLPFLAWGLAVVGGWNASALIFLLTTWWIIIRADSSRAPQLAAREDQTEGSARVLLVGASVAVIAGLRVGQALASRTRAELAAQAGVPVIKLHEGGRHTGNSLMRDAGVDQEVRMREVGHAGRDINDRYTHVLIEAHLAAAEQTAALVRGAGTTGP
jgi:uncharacterized membrane protein